MNIKPLRNHLLIKIEKVEAATKSGIILAGSAKGEANIAIILETADCCEEDQNEFLKGDKILILPHAGTKVNLGKDELFIVSQKDVLAKLS